MSDIHGLRRSRQGDALMQPEVFAIPASIGPCMVVGALSWLVLFSLYHWLA